MEEWRNVWREGIAPQALRRALVEDDPCLIQGDTTEPPVPLSGERDVPCQGACALAYALWEGQGLSGVRQVDMEFNHLFDEVDERMKAPDGANWAGDFTRWFDDTPREQMRQLLLAEVELALAGRKQEACPQ